MMLRNGKAGSRQVVPARWVHESIGPKDREAVNPAEPLMGYHYQWWPIVGSDAYLARGLQGQAIFIDPATDTVVVKLSYFPPGNQQAFVESVAFLQAAVAN